MKNIQTYILLLAALVAAIAFSSCKDDDLPDGQSLLNHDGTNFNAPLLPAGTFEAGARFVSADLSKLVGDDLTEVQFYLKSIPRTTELRIYRGSNGNEPDTMIYSANLTTGREGEAWNTHTLTQPIGLTSEDLWINVRFTHDTDLRTLGCDEGPAAPNGDWLYDQADQSWIKLNERGTVDINWNIRGVVSPK